MSHAPVIAVLLCACSRSAQPVKLPAEMPPAASLPESIPEPYAPSAEDRRRPSFQRVEAKLKRIISEQLDVDERDIKPESTFVNDLGADSYGLVELLLNVEEASELDIPDQDTANVSTVGEAILYVEHRIANRNTD
jgi:acyl carrier protein